MFPRVLGRNCDINSTIVVLNQWHPLFDASKENIVLLPILLRMRRLLLKWSTIDVFKSVGNRLQTLWIMICIFRKMVKG